MSYLHCHNCGWQQDDFWDSSYNPTIILWRNIKDYIWPRWIRMDKNAFENRFYPYKYVRARYIADRGPETKPINKEYYWVYEITSSEMLYRAIHQYFRVRKNMKWKTEKDFENDPLKQCPRCGGTEHWDID